MNAPTTGSRAATTSPAVIDRSRGGIVRRAGREIAQGSAGGLDDHAAQRTHRGAAASGGRLAKQSELYRGSSRVGVIRLGHRQDIIA